MSWECSFMLCVSPWGIVFVVLWVTVHAQVQLKLLLN